MNEKLEKETKKLNTAEQRRKLELEGYSSDLSAMKKKIAFYEKYISKLKKLVDEDQAELLNAAIEEDVERTAAEEAIREEQEEEDY